MQAATDIAQDGPGFLSGLLWAAAVLTICTLSIGALYQRAEPGPAITASAR